MSLFGCDHGPLIAQLRDSNTLLRERLTVTEAQLALERDRSDDLLSRLLSMKASGFNLPPIVPAPEQVAKIELQEPDELMALVHERAENPRVRGMMLRQLAKDRAKGRSPEQIEQDILNGVQADGVPA